MSDVDDDGNRRMGIPMYRYDDFIGSLKSEKAREQMRNAVTWLEENAEVAKRLCPQPMEHPGILFSKVMDGLIAALAGGDDRALSTLVAWICRDERAPFGMIIKIKALKTMARNASRIGPQDWLALAHLRARADRHRYRPREYLYLDKLLAKRGDQP